MGKAINRRGDSNDGTGLTPYTAVEVEVEVKVQTYPVVEVQHISNEQVELTYGRTLLARRPLPPCLLFHKSVRGVRRPEVNKGKTERIKKGHTQKKRKKKRVISRGAKDDTVSHCA